MQKFELPQKDESRAQSADSSKAYRKSAWGFDCVCTWLQQRVQKGLNFYARVGA